MYSRIGLLRGVPGIENDDGNIRHSLAKELAVTICTTQGDSDDDESFNPRSFISHDSHNLNPEDHGILFSILCKIGLNIDFDFHYVDDNIAFSRGRSALHILLT